MSSGLSCYSFVHAYKHIACMGRMHDPDSFMQLRGAPPFAFANRMHVRLTMLPGESHFPSKEGTGFSKGSWGRSPVETGGSKLAKSMRPTPLRRVENPVTRRSTTGSGGLYDGSGAHPPGVSHLSSPYFSSVLGPEQAGSLQGTGRCTPPIADAS